jgi:hypothetical protein
VNIYRGFSGRPSLLSNHPCPLLRALCLLLMAPLYLAGQNTYDVVADFSITSNPNGNWSYGYTAGLGSTFHLHSSAQVDTPAGIDRWYSPGVDPGVLGIARNKTGSTFTGTPATFTYPSDMLHMHQTVPNIYDVVRWTAPQAGQYTLQGLYRGLDFVTTVADTDVHVLLNSTTELMPMVVLHGDGTSAPIQITRALNAGDTIDFAVGIGPSGFHQNDSTGLRVTIAGTAPPPSTGTITVTSTPLGAGFQLQGPGLTHYSGTTPITILNAPAGDYKLTWNILSGGYRTPPYEVKTLPASETIAFSATYLLPSLSVSPNLLNFSYQAGATRSPIPSQTLKITANDSSLPVTIISDTSTAWLSVVPTSGLTPQTVSVTVLTGLKPGTYTTNILITSPSIWNSPLVVPITLTVTSGPVQAGTGTILIMSNLMTATFSISPNIPGRSAGPYPVSLSNVEPGKYMITFDHKPGYFTPPPQQLMVSPGASTLVSTKYKRALVVLFTGFRSAPPDRNKNQYPPGWNDSSDPIGMATLANNMATYAPLEGSAHAAVFTYYSLGNGGAACDTFLLHVACTPPRDNNDDPEPEAWLKSFDPGEEDRIIVIGHSYGGNRARLFAEQLRKLSYTVDLLGLVDPIDWSLCSIYNLGEYCKQATFNLELQPDNVVLSQAYVQSLGPVQGYHLNTNRYVYPFTDAPEPFTTVRIPCLWEINPFCSHMAIDDQDIVQQGLLALTLQSLRTPRRAIFGISTSPVASRSASISWSTYEATSGEVLLAADETLTRWYVAGSDYATNHFITLTGLTPGTTYYYRLSSTAVTASPSTSVYSDVYTFTTLP